MTLRTLTKLKQNLPQSILISGRKGLGLSTIAHWIKLSDFAVTLQPQNSKEQIDNENGTITVEMIRRLYEQTRAKQTSRQTIIIDDADRMSHAAQSAFLKLLEEPGVATSFILTSHQPEKLLPTIRSRVQQTVIEPITTEQTQEFIDSLGVSDATKKIQLQYIANGMPAELTRLVRDDDRFAARANIISDARDLLQGDAYKKVLVVQKYRSNRVLALQLIDSAMAMLRQTMSTKPSTIIVGQLEQLLDTRERISNNYSVALQLMQFVL